LKSILSGVRVKEEEFLSIVKIFTAGLDNFKVTKIPCQIVYWFNKDEEYKALLIAFILIGKPD
jgi:hypothetical protein